MTPSTNPASDVGPFVAGVCSPGTEHAPGELFPLETFEQEACPRCGVDPCACEDHSGDFDAASDLEPIVEAKVIEWPIQPNPPRAGEGDRQQGGGGAARYPSLTTLRAWTERRREILAAHGDKAFVHPDRDPALMARDLRERAGAIADRLISEPSPDRDALALRTLDSAGAILLALREKLTGGAA